MTETIRSEIRTSLEELGYSFDKRLYAKISKLSYKYPSYKIMADIVFKAIESVNYISKQEAWKYTTEFVDGMKSNLILNNKYFQSVLKNGLYNKETKDQDSNMNLFFYDKQNNNIYNFVEKVYIKSYEYIELFDFVLTINRFPMILINIIDPKNSNGFEEAFNKLENSFNKIPMFFNFNKLIILTDGSNYKLGTIYDFSEDYIEFNKEDKSSKKNHQYNIKVLKKIISKKYIMEIIKESNNSKDIKSFIDNILINRENNEIEKKPRKSEDLDFLSDFFNPDLEEVLDSDDFKSKLTSMKEVPDFKLNKEYIEDIQKSEDLDTTNTLLEANSGLVFKVAGKYNFYETTSMDFDDMVQYGYIGLLKALERFDIEKENEFSTYATYWIRQSIMRGISNDSLLIRVPVHNWESISKLESLEKKSEIMFGDINYDWVKDELNITEDKLIELLKIRNTFIRVDSLDKPVGIDKDTSLGELYISDKYSVEDSILEKDLYEKLKHEVSKLDDRSQDIIVKRFGLDGKEPMTLEKIGKIHGISRERVRQLESEIFNKLKKRLNFEKYRTYCEG